MNHFLTALGSSDLPLIIAQKPLNLSFSPIADNNNNGTHLPDATGRWDCEEPGFPLGVFQHFHFDIVQFIIFWIILALLKYLTILKS